MIQVKAFSDTLYATAEKKANRFLSTLDPSQYVDTKLIANSDAANRENACCILIVYRTAIAQHG